MTLFSVLTRLLSLLPVALCLSGCFLPGEGPVEEEKDPHYLAGKNRVSSLDYDGAIAAFESALNANPKSAAAHLELGLLYEERKNDFGAAIYHFQKHLELRPESNMAETIKQHVLACKLELAKTVPFALVNRQVQDELRKLYATNSLLHEQVEQLKTQLTEQAAVFSNKLVLAAQAALQAQTASQVHAPTAAPVEPERRMNQSERQPPPGNSHVAPRIAAAPRTHVVKSGETLVMIAKKYNIKLTALQAVNPNVDPRRLRAGQTLSLPPAKN